jgi:hypothetical protein
MPVLACFVYFPAEFGTETRSNGSGSKNGAEHTLFCRAFTHSKGSRSVCVGQVVFGYLKAVWPNLVRARRLGRSVLSDCRPCSAPSGRASPHLLHLVAMMPRNKKQFLFWLVSVMSRPSLAPRPVPKRQALKIVQNAPCFVEPSLTQGDPEVCLLAKLFLGT